MPRIKFLKNYDDHKKDAVVLLDEKSANHLVSIGLAEAVPDEDPLTNLAAVIKNAVSQGFAAGAAEVTSKAYDPKHPANALRVDAVESAIDKQKSFSDQLKWITIAQCPNTYPGRQAEAQEHLGKVYGSTFNNWSTKASLAESSGTTGGYTVAPTYAEDLLKLAAEESIIRPIANKKTLPAREAYYPMLNQTSGQPTNGSNYFGGAYVTWTSEASSIPQTGEPTFKQVHVVTNEVTALAKISRTLLSDSFLSLDAELKGIFAGAVADEEDYQFLNGNGVNKPLGILTATDVTKSVTRTTASNFKLADAANMMGKLLPRSRPNSVWLMESLLFPQLVQLVDASGRVTYVPNVGSGYGDAKLATGQLLLFGRPVVFTEKLPALGTTGDVTLVDGRYYIVADTGTLEIAVSDQYAFNTNQLTFRVLKRTDGRPQLDNAFTQRNGNVVTPFVTMT